MKGKIWNMADTKVINCLSKSQTSTGTCGKRKKERKKRNNRKRVKTGMENAIETNRVKTANVMYSRYVKTNWIVESSVRKRETVASRKASTICQRQLCASKQLTDVAFVSQL